MSTRLILLLALCSAPLHAVPLKAHTVIVQSRNGWHSMGSYLRDGDLIAVLPVPMSLVREHQTIEVRPVNGCPVFSYSHEVIAIRRAANGGLYFITKGTANLNEDTIHVTEKEYAGVLDIPPIVHRHL